jgi:acetyl esterase/lipase
VLSWVYLLLSANGAAYTYNAYRPATQNQRVRFVPSFFASWLTLELAWFHLLWEAAATAFFIRKGALRHWAGRLGLLITLANWVGLVVTIRHSLGSRHEVARALAEVNPDGVGLRRHKVQRIRGVEYSQEGRHHLKLDVFRPVDPPAPGERRPALVQVHGGAWVMGTRKEQAIPLMNYMASRGWVCFSIDYRLSPQAVFPEHLIDVKRAVAWVREHADEYGVDPDFVAITGGSAGGHLSSLAALTENDPALQPGFEDADTSIQAAVPFYGVYDFTNRDGAMHRDFVANFLEPVVMKASLRRDPEKFEQASPYDQTHADAPPFLVVHGEKDTLAPVEQARSFVEKLRAESNQAVHYLELKGAQHAFDMFPSIRTNNVLVGVDRFLTMVHAEYLQRRGEAVSAEDRAVLASVAADGELVPELASVADSADDGALVRASDVATTS